MGYRYRAKCKSCGHEFTANSGGGIATRCLVCEDCGQPTLFGRFEKPTHCQCGGKLSSTAAYRCPECRSTDFEELYGIMLWD